MNLIMYASNQLLCQSRELSVFFRTMFISTTYDCRRKKTEGMIVKKIIKFLYTEQERCLVTSVISVH